ncbi:PREDICTED: serine/threonine-protein kinase Chk2-like [Cyphomyrmex costatus]|uniref:Serine/threonine-protein kinase Chk2 n=1 Tax=Cyphomyrmex costatus TaxID=456900 RepID=A0A151IFC5_9HYME|nr:PREDICTED: serine/threonine-protein kinase Chk2-like [Cyphomyrmex costatus]KYM99653.1 Serine/threonine-protein kinase Chk2 [Cyphomyrmex costatus]
MTSQELPASLPDTQNADAILTQSQEVSRSQQPTMTVWGRLCPRRPFLRSLEMVRDDVYTLGRSPGCDICITTRELSIKQLSVVSKVHFRIYRERVSNMNETVVYLEDLSRNGTYVNQELVGHGKRVIIGNNSEIALARSFFSFYIFMGVNALEINCELPLELKQRYVIGRKLGTGACGEVRLLFKKDGSETFAIKIIQKNYFNIGTGNILNNPENVRNEVEILRKLKHPCIIPLKDIFDTTEIMYIILELMEGGELFDRIRSKGNLSESCAKLIFYQVVHAVHYLHKQGITHRDLKPENILLKDNSENPLVKVSDFGMSKFVDAQTMMRTFCGTPMYVAPEILATNGRSPYTNQVDVWSLGVILYVSLSGRVPFTNNNASLADQIKGGMYHFRLPPFQRVSQDAIHLIKCMMTVEPKKRIRIPQVLLHPWLRDINMQREVNKLMSGYNGDNDENLSPPNIHPNKRPRLML